MRRLSTLVALAAAVGLWALVATAAGAEPETVRIAVTGEGPTVLYKLEREGSKCRVSRQEGAVTARTKALPPAQFDQIMSRFGSPVIRGLRRDPVPEVKDCVRTARIEWSGLTGFSGGPPSGSVGAFCLRPREASGAQAFIEYLDSLTL